MDKCAASHVCSTGWITPGVFGRRPGASSSHSQFALLPFGAKSGVFWRLSQDSVFRCNLKGMFLALIYTLYSSAQ